jgi:hypothetical protein
LELRERDHHLGVTILERSALPFQTSYLHHSTATKEITNATMIPKPTTVSEGIVAMMLAEVSVATI